MNSQNDECSNLDNQPPAMFTPSARKRVAFAHFPQLKMVGGLAWSTRLAEPERALNNDADEGAGLEKTPSTQTLPRNAGASPP